MKGGIALIMLIAVVSATGVMGADLPRPENPVPVFVWGPWKAAVSPDGTIQNLYISHDEREEMDVLIRLGKEMEELRRREYSIEPNNWKVIATFSDSIDMVYVDEDGTRFHEKGGLSPEDREWVDKNYQQYIDAAYAFSRGSVVINAEERRLEEPLVGEYRGSVSFWMSGWPDLGVGLDVYDFDSVTGIWYEGPCRPWSRGAFTGGHDWVKRLGHSNAQFARGREVGGPIGDISKITRHEWGHGVSGFVHRCGYTGLPTQYTPGNYHHGSHLFFFRNVLAPAHWRAMRQQGPLSSPANRPDDRYLGFSDTWLVIGPFDLPAGKLSTEAGIPHPGALDEDFISSEVLPDEEMETSGRKWSVLTTERERNTVNIRRVLTSPHVDTLVYAHTYVFSPDEREAILWAGCMQPAQVYLNGSPAMRFWRGGYEDGAWRKVILKKGWNRIMYKILDQGENQMEITLRFTDTQHHVMTDLSYSDKKPDGEIILEAMPLPPLEVKKYTWDWPVNDDWYGQLPLLTEEHLDFILGMEGVRILGAPTKWRDRDLQWHERRWTLIDTSSAKGNTKVNSRVVPWNSLKNTLENTLLLDNLLVMSRELGTGQRSYEAMGIIRYERADGKKGDLVFLRADVAEMFISTGKKPEEAPEDFHSKNIVGHILRDTKNYIVLDTDLGGHVPVNEFDMLVARNEGMELEASPSVPRVLRGNPAELNLIARWNGASPVKAKAVIRRFDTGEVIAEKMLGEMKPGTSGNLSHPLDTGAMKGLVNFIASVEYVNGLLVEKPVPLPVFDPVEITVSMDGTGIIQVPDKSVRVTLSSNMESQIDGRVSLELPRGWRSRPSAQNYNLPGIDATQELTFEITVPANADNGWTEIIAQADARARRGASTGSLPVLVSMGDVLIAEDFETGIGGSFSFTDGMYQVQSNVSGPKDGQRCLHVYDRGGSHYGHVFMFGPGERPSPVPSGMKYSYDTKLYPWVEFWLKTTASNANLGLQVVLDDGDDGYGVLINGFWEQQWLPRMLVGSADGFVADGEWRLVRINLDEMLDGVLGKTSHFVQELQFGDTRGFASGWSWSFDYYHHYIDGFRIYRESRPKTLAHVEKTADGLPRYSTTHRVPAFPSRSVDGIKATLRTDRLEYNPWHEQRIRVWLTNTSDETVSIPVEPWRRLWQVRFTDAKDEIIGGDWAFFGAEDEKEQAFKAEDYRSLRPGESFSREIRLNELIGGWQERNNVKLIDGMEYSIEAKFLYRVPENSEEPGNISAGPVVSNSISFAFAEVATLEEEMQALKESLSPVRRARAAAQLGKARHEEAIPVLAGALKDSDADVRLNAVWALGNMPRLNPDDTGQEEYAKKIGVALEGLRDCLKDPNWRVAEYAAQSLANLNVRDYLDHIIQMAWSESAWIRRRTADALRTMQDARGIPALVGMMNDKSRSARQSALSGLIAFADQNVNAAKDSNAQNHESAKKIFESAWEGISRGLDDEYFVIRRDAVSASVKYQPMVNATEIVGKALDDYDDWVREAAIRALPELQEKVSGAEERLVGFMSSYWDNIRRAAVETYPAVSGKSVEEGTGKDAGYWMRKYPRPGDTWKN